MPWFEFQGQSVFYAARGESGPPVVFVHGSGGSHLAWNGQLAALADTARAAALDLPGHGRSRPPGRASVRAYADVVCGFLDALAVERAIIVGHSLGGAIAQTLALENPDRILGLGLVGTGARLRVLPAFLEGLLADLAATVHTVTEAEFASEADPRLKQLSEQQMLACPPQVVHDDFAACDVFDVMPRLDSIRVPTLVLCGSEDRMTPVKYSQYLAAHIPRARLVVVQGAGHMVMVEKPDEVNRALSEWIAGVAAQT